MSDDSDKKGPPKHNVETSFQDIIDLLTKLFALTAGITTVVVLAGGAVIGLRLHHSSVPAEGVLGDLPKELLITTGLVEVILPTALATTACFLLLPQTGGVSQLIARTWSMFIAAEHPERRVPRRPQRRARSRGAIKSWCKSRTKKLGLNWSESAFAFVDAVLSLQGAIGFIGVLLLPVPLIGWVDSVLMVPVTAAILLTAVIGNIVYEDRRAKKVSVVNSLADVAIVVLVILAMGALVVYTAWAPNATEILVPGLLAAGAAFVFILSVTVIQHKFEDTPRSLGALAAATLVAGTTIAPWFVDYARNRPLLPVKVCMASGKPFFGTMVGQTSSRIYVAREGRFTLQSLPLDKTTAILTREANTKAAALRWVPCPPRKAGSSPATSPTS